MKKQIKSFVDVDHARYKDQKDILKKIIDDKVCPFCSNNLYKYHHEPILKKGKFWILTYNQWPRKNTKTHLLAIYIPHAEKLSEMNPKSGEELLKFLIWSEKKFKVVGGAFAIRFGNSKHSGASVRHIHAQFISPDKNKNGYEPVNFKIG